MCCQMLTMFCVGLPAGSKAVHEGKTRVDLCREVAFRKLVDRSRIGLLWRSRNCQIPLQARCRRARIIVR